MSKQTVCTGQCHGCAYKTGAAANGEPDNCLRGLICALGGIPFYCHESMGWTPDKQGYTPGTLNSISILSARPALLKVGASPELIRQQTEAVRQSMRICGGWSRAVRQLQGLGWFADPEVRKARQAMAHSAGRDLDGITDETPDRLRDVRMRNLTETFDWFLQEAKEARVNISFLFSRQGNPKGHIPAMIRRRLPKTARV